jgi:hypothetical protein
MESAGPASRYARARCIRGEGSLSTETNGGTSISDFTGP